MGFTFVCGIILAKSLIHWDAFPFRVRLSAAFAQSLIEQRQRFSEGVMPDKWMPCFEKHANDAGFLAVTDGDLTG